MNKKIQVSTIAALTIVAAMFGIIASNMDNEPALGNAALASLPLEKQIEKVDYAIIGVVKEVKAPYPDKNAHPEIPRYFGDVIVTVEEDLLGTINEKEITIRTLANVRETPMFEQGERAILFLIPSHPNSVEGEGVYVVSGMHQGKYSISDGIVQDPRNVELSYNEMDLKTQIKNKASNPSS